MEPLEGLAISPLRLRIEITTPFRAPEYKGALFRGGFGAFFRELVCVTRAPSCAGCPHLETCSYSRVFETPVIPGKFEVLRKYPNAPHPFVLTPPLDPRTVVPSGTELALECTLIGAGRESLPHFLVVLNAMGRSGRYGGGFRVKSAASALPGGPLVFDGLTRRLLCEPPLWAYRAGPANADRVRLEFVTPLRMRTEGRYNARPDFVAVVKALLRRIHLLAAIYGGGNGDASWMHPLLAAADRVVTERREFRMYHWARTSGRQERRVEMDGVVGWLEARGELGPLMPYLRAGEWLHVGSGTSMGMGGYRLYVNGQTDGEVPGPQEVPGSNDRTEQIRKSEARKHYETHGTSMPKRT